MGNQYRTSTSLIEQATKQNPTLKQVLNSLFSWQSSFVQASGIDPHVPAGVQGFDSLLPPPIVQFVQVQTVQGVFKIKITPPANITAVVYYQIESSETLPFETSTTVIQYGPVLSSYVEVTAPYKTLYWRVMPKYTNSKYGPAYITKAVESSGTWLNARDFGAVGDGVVDDYPALQTAINYAVLTGRALFIPFGTYYLSAALDCHNTDGLKIFGEGCEVPASGLVFYEPNKGTILKGDTGTGGCFIDAVGSTGLQLSDFSFSYFGTSTPSTIGIIIGTSTRTFPTVDGGGGAAFFSNLAFYLPLAVESYSIYGNNFNNSVMLNLWSIGGWGITIVSNNERSVTPPYGTFGIIVQNDGLSMIGCVWSTDGTGPGWYFRAVNEFTAVQNYIVTIVNGVGYAGYKYAIDIGDCAAFDAGLEIDYYPTAGKFSGVLDNVTIKGILFNNGAAIDAGTPIVARFENTSIRNVDFSKFLPIMGAAPNTNYFYDSVTGGSPTIGGIQGFKGWFDTAISPNAGFFNATNAAAVPFRDFEFFGNTDTPTIVFDVNGSAATQDQFQSIFVNGFPIRQPIPAFANSATPSAKAGQGPERNFLTGGTTTITNITDGFEGLKITVFSQHAVTITDGTNLFLSGSANFAMQSTDTLTLVQKADGKWYEVSRSDNT